MHARRPLLAIASLIAIAACAEMPSEPAAPDALANARGANGARRIGVMTRNLYVGADVDAVIGALVSPDPNDDLPALQSAIATLQHTDFPARAAAFANEFATQRPAVIGLQEVYQLHVDLTPLGMPVNIDMDFLAILQAAISARHLPYAVAAKVKDTDATPFPGITLVDYDVMLVDTTRVVVAPGAVTNQFAYNIGPVAPGVDIRRGYIIVNATVDGVPLTLANTHLESGSDPQIAMLRAAQATELATVLAAAPALILTGDFNDTPGSPMYQVLAGAGFTDAWATLRPGVIGLTCCNLADLSNGTPTFDQRIDYIFSRGIGHPTEGLLGSIGLTGTRPGDRISGPAGLIWPSDHAGVNATLLVPVAQGLR